MDPLAARRIKTALMSTSWQPVFVGLRRHEAHNGRYWRARLAQHQHGQQSQKQRELLPHVINRRSMTAPRRMLQV